LHLDSTYCASARRRRKHEFSAALPGAILRAVFAGSYGEITAKVRLALRYASSTCDGAREKINEGVRLGARSHDED
jgi:hypothetical protein